MDHDRVRAVDPEAADALEGEIERQRSTLQLIASENHVSEAVLDAQGSALTNKYAEGYPGARYYGGCEHADRIEELARERAEKLWGADHVNVQPHSGTQANQAVYFAMLEPGDKILSLDLNHGGHLSHGHRVNFTGQFYEVEQYEVDPDTGYLDYEDVRETAEAFDPDIVVSGYSAYPREVDWERIQQAADAADAYHLADIAHITGLVAAGVHDSPVGIADFVTGSTHKTVRAGRGGIVMCKEQYAEEIDKAVFPGGQGGPLMHNIAGKAVGFKEALDPEFTEYAEQTVANAKALGDRLQEHGFSLVSGGTDNHLLLVDLRDSHPDVSGGEIEDVLVSLGLVLNANTVPGETRSPFNPSGVRIGTPSITTRGFDEDACRRVADLLEMAIDAYAEDRLDEVEPEIEREVEELCAKHPLYE